MNTGTSPFVEGDLHRLRSSNSSDLSDLQAAVDPMEEIISETPPPSKLRFVTTARQQKCSTCGQVGHNSGLLVTHLSFSHFSNFQITGRSRNCPEYVAQRPNQRAKKPYHTGRFRVKPKPENPDTSHLGTHYTRMQKKNQITGLVD